MPGWRMGFAAGNEKLIGALARIKSYLDYGAFTPIQVAAAAALNGPVEMIDEIRAVYKSRRDVLVKSMAAAGWDIPAPQASMFAWAPVPEKYRELGSMEFAKDLLIHARVAVLARHRLSASMAKAMSASRWSRMSIASARRRAM